MKRTNSSKRHKPQARTRLAEAIDNLVVAPHDGEPTPCVEVPEEANFVRNVDTNKQGLQPVLIDMSILSLDLKQRMIAEIISSPDPEDRIVSEVVDGVPIKCLTDCRCRKVLAVKGSVG